MASFSSVLSQTLLNPIPEYYLLFKHLLSLCLFHFFTSFPVIPDFYYKYNNNTRVA
jgi:hypothetical protein